MTKYQYLIFVVIGVVFMIISVKPMMDIKSLSRRSQIAVMAFVLGFILLLTSVYGFTSSNTNPVNETLTNEDISKMINAAGQKK